jgi:hypothetical protein
MGDFTEIPATPPPVPLTESGQASLADEVLQEPASLPVPPGASYTRPWSSCAGQGQPG